MYGASDVSVKVGNGQTVSFTEETAYPFEEQIRFTYGNGPSINFPFHLRIPAWCSGASININGQPFQQLQKGDTVVVIKRAWKPGDVLTLNLPMDVKTSRWAENSVAVERGPIVYALKVGEKWEEKTNAKEKHPFYEVVPATAWNYGIPQEAVQKKAFEVKKKTSVPLMPWNQSSAPIEIITDGPARKNWTLYNHSAGKLPRSRVKTDLGEPEKSR